MNGNFTQWIPAIIGFTLVAGFMIHLIWMQNDYHRKMDNARKRHVKDLNDMLESWSKQSKNKDK